MTLESALAQAVSRRRRDGTARVLRVLPASNVDFCSNDYLGLGRSAVLANLIASTKATTNGSTGSRLITGNSKLHDAVEAELAAFYGSPAALVFNSGYLANLSVMSSVPQRDDLVIYDELVHNSCREGLRLCRAKTLSFRHNDVRHVQQLLEAHCKEPNAAEAAGAKKRNVLVVVESVYSMDGDIAPLRQLVDLCEVFGANLVVDEAHSTAVMGPNGSGLVRALGLEQRVFCTVYTFGKGMGIHGAVVCGSQTLKDYLINYARPFIYSTSLPEHDMLVIQSAHRVCAASDAARKRLTDLIAHFRSLVKQQRSIPSEALLPSDTAIQGIVIPGNQAALDAAAFITEQGFNVVAIRAPTVPAGSERLRIILHAFNTPEEISSLVNTISLLFQRRSAL